MPRWQLNSHPPLNMNIRNSRNPSVPGKAENVTTRMILRPRDRCFSRAYFKLRVVEAGEVAGAGTLTMCSAPNKQFSKRDGYPWKCWS